MLRNYFVIATRNLLKSKMFSVINIVGLSIGIACSLIVALFVIDQQSFDRDNVNAPNLYRVVHTQTSNNQTTKIALTQGLMATELLKNFPEVKSATRVGFTSETLIMEGKDPKEKKIIGVDSSYFSMFTVPMLKHSSKREVLSEEGILISESEALTVFGKENPIDEVIKLKDLGEFKVEGVYKDLLRSHLRTDYIIRFNWIEKGYPFANSWNFNSFYSYVLLSPGEDIEALSKKIDVFVDRHTPEGWKTFDYFLQPLLEIYTDDSFTNNPSPSVGTTWSYAFAGIGGVVLLLACFNYMNMATARSTGRSLEVGVRKVMGAQRRQLVFQFLSESMIVVTISFALAILWADLMIPAFKMFTNASAIEMMRFDISNFFYDYRLVLGLIICNVLLAVLAGVYPSFYLSRFVPAKVLKGRKGNYSSRMIRKAIVSVQFTLTTILLVGVLVIFRQVEYMKNKDLGFKKDGLLVFGAALDSTFSAEAFKAELLAVSGVERIAVASSLPGRNPNSTGMRKLGGTPDQEVQIGWTSIDHEYIPTLELTLVAGRNFFANGADENTGVIINEKACQEYGWSVKDAIGQKVSGFIFTDSLPGEVIGVIKDFNVNSLRKPIAPLALNYQASNNRYIVQIVGDPLEVRHRVDEKIRTLLPGTLFESRLMNDYLDNFYQVEEKLGQLVTFFAILAIVIGCLGLYALSAYEAEQRTRELGVRKIMGATTSQLLILLSKTFLKPVVIAMVFAMPAAFFLGNLWLQNFPYHAEWSPLIFMEAAAWLIFLGWFTVIGQGIRASIRNPADVLRHE
jgi:putative ABC transport system permease protein